MNKVSIKNLTVSACHGLHDFEKVNAQRFVFSADLYTDFYSAAQSDDIQNTVNYSLACKTIYNVTTQNTFNLIEKLVYECAFALFESQPNINRVVLTVEKPDAPIKLDFESVSVSVDLIKEKAYLSLGSSIGDKEQILNGAIAALNATRGIKVKKVSSFIKTAPYGGVAQNEFLNCAVEIETVLSPRQLLSNINKIEADFLRTREVRWGDRTLDIDVIFYGKRIILQDDLIIPHIDYHNRDFVLIPLKEIAPNFICPLKKVKVSDL
ncbi:MAG: 2-amino-4-hydroxy-6-hydroxymethyldihydropteridine diphosphokinase [Clostridiales bacterium]|nr:2-amino-4-hydroxy-6-hydroxymethyldihydropteridine diphosphokinase [Clostridiales bacterium]